MKGSLSLKWLCRFFRIEWEYRFWKLAKLFRDREVVGINCTELIWGLGALHCMTQQQPRGCLIDLGNSIPPAREVQKQLLFGPRMHTYEHG